MMCKSETIINNIIKVANRNASLETRKWWVDQCGKMLKLEAEKEAYEANKNLLASLENIQLISNDAVVANVRQRL